MRESEKFIASSVTILGKQEGHIENVFTKKIAEFLISINFKGEAYLARVAYDNKITEFNVAICLRVLSGECDNVEAGIANIFARIFRKSEHIDTIVLSHEKYAEIRALMEPFYDCYLERFC